jgi:hypothetical protein
VCPLIVATNGGRMAIVAEQAVDLAPDPGDRGLATQDPSELARRTARAWELLTDLAAGADLEDGTRTDRTAKELLTGLGRWPDSRWVAEALAEARAGSSPAERIDQDAEEDRLRAAHRRATGAAVIRALRRAGTQAEAFFGSKDDEAYGLRSTASTLGPLPLRTFLHATAYRVTVAALDLQPALGTDAAPAFAELMELGLVALVDVVGALSAREGLSAQLTGDTDVGVWTFVAADGSWRVVGAEAGVRPPAGPAVIGSAQVLLDVSSGRADDVGGLYRRHELRLEDVPGLLRLAPLLDQVPGIPGAPGLRFAARGFELASRTMSAFGRLRRPFSQSG